MSGPRTLSWCALVGHGHSAVRARYATPARKCATPVRERATPVRECATPVRECAAPVRKCATVLRKCVAVLRARRSALYLFRTAAPGSATWMKLDQWSSLPARPALIFPELPDIL